MQKQSTRDLYERQLAKITNPYNVELTIHEINKMYTNINSKRTVYNALWNYDEKYKEISIELKKQVDSNYLNNKKTNISLKELKDILLTFKKDILTKHKTIFENEKLACKYMFLHMVIMHPLRLDWYNLSLEPKTDENYLLQTKDGFELYMQDFKNVKYMGFKIIKFKDVLLKKYIKAFCTDKLLLYYNNGIKPFNNKTTYSMTITRLIKKYSGLDMSNNTIRQIHATALIQSSKYKKLTNEQKKDLHEQMLHSTTIAHNIYNKV